MTMESKVERSQQKHAPMEHAALRATSSEIPTEEAFDRIIALTKRLLRVPAAAVSLLERDRAHYRSRLGFDDDELPSGVIFSPGGDDAEGVVAVEDAAAHGQPTAPSLPSILPHVGSYALAPLVTAEGYRVGALYALDDVPRTFSAEQLSWLGDLAALVVAEFELRLSRRFARSELDRRVRAEQRLKMLNRLLQRVASADNYGAALEAFLSGLTEHYGASCGIIYELSDEPVLPAATCAPFGGDNHNNFLKVAAAMPLPPGGAITWTALREEAAALSLESEESGDPLLDLAREAGFASALILPLADIAKYTVALLFDEPTADIHLVAADAGELSRRLVPLLARQRLASQLSEQRALVDLIVQNLEVPIVGFDHDLRYTLWSASMATRTGLDPADVVGRTDQEIFGAVNPVAIAAAEPAKRKALRGEPGVVLDIPYRKADGQPSFYDANYVPLRDEAGSVFGAMGFLSDAGARRAAERERMEASRQEARARFERMAASSPSAIVCISDGLITYWNLAAEGLLDRRAEDVLGHPANLLVPARDRVAFDARLQAVIGDDPPKIAERWHVERRDGTVLLAEGTWASWTEGGRPVIGLTLNDVSNRERHEALLRQRATTDPLTGLANRACATAALAQEFDPARPLSAILFDLDGFKLVNDSLGHSAGDQILCDVAARMRDAIDQRGMLARLGGDEFLLVARCESIDDVRALGHHVQQSLAAPFEVASRTFTLSATAGAALALSSQDQRSLLSDADLAMYEAKAAGRGSLRLYDVRMRETYEAQRELELEFQQAVRKKQLAIYFQPQVRLVDGAMIGAEALLRWHHPHRGTLLPRDFMPAMVGNIAAEVGFWVLDQSIRHAKEWLSRGRPLRVSVNVCVEQLTLDKLEIQAAETLTRWSVPAELLELELTETIALNNMENAISSLSALRDRGVNIAFDDFGTGYASLSSLTRFPVNRLKIDRSFVSTLCEREGSAAVVDATLSLADRLGLSVIAEGIETSEQADYLQARGCPEGQGFLYGVPVPADELVIE